MQAGDLADWTPVRIIVAPPEPVIDWSPFRDYRFTEPFFGETIERILRAAPDHPLIRTSLSALASVETASPGRDPDAFIFHMSRCGSTLASRLIASLPDIAVISEPDCLNALLELDPSTVQEDVLVTCVRLLIRALCRGRPEPRAVLKLSSWNIRRAYVIAAAFPTVNRALIYRDPAEILASLIVGAPGWMRARLERPEQAAWLLSVPSAERMNDTDFALAALEGLFQAALAEDARQAMRLIDYRELPAAIWDRLLPFIGRQASPAETAALSLAASWHAKTPGQRFLADSTKKRAKLPPDTLTDVASRLGPLYMELEQRRIDRLGC